MNKRQRIYTVFVATLVATSMIAVMSVGAVTAAGPSQPFAGGGPGGPFAGNGPGGPNAGGGGNIGIGGVPASVDFKGCSEVWIIFQDPSILPKDATIEIGDSQSTQGTTVTITEPDLESVGLYDDPLFKYPVESGDDKIVAVSVDGSSFVQNPNRCAQNAA